jgi:hypothetical protein
LIAEIGIWRAANLMIERYGDMAEVESARLADAGDYDGAAVWRRVVNAVAQLENTKPSGPVH